MFAHADWGLLSGENACHILEMGTQKASHHYGYVDADLKWHVDESCEGNTHTCMVSRSHESEDAVSNGSVVEIAFHIRDIHTA